MESRWGLSSNESLSLAELWTWAAFSAQMAGGGEREELFAFKELCSRANRSEGESVGGSKGFKYIKPLGRSSSISSSLPVAFKAAKVTRLDFSRCKTLF